MIIVFVVAAMVMSRPVKQTWQAVALATLMNVHAGQAHDAVAILILEKRI